MGPDPDKKPTRAQRLREQVPNVNKEVWAYLSSHKIVNSEIREITHLPPTTVYSLKKGRKSYVDTLYILSVAFKQNFFKSILKQMYEREPECAKGDPLYKELEKLRKENQALKTELEKLRARPK